MNTYIEVYDNALSSDECRFIIDYINSSPLERGQMGYGVDLRVKDSWDLHSRFDNETVIDNIICTALNTNLPLYIQKYAEIDQIGSWGLENQYNLQKYYPGGGYFSTHCEADDGSHSKRMLVWMIYLNTLDGGTKFNQYDIITDAVEGRLVLWPAGWTHFHQGVVSATETKYIATGWYSFA